MRPKSHIKTRRKAFILVETMIGLAVAAAAIAIAGSAMSQYRSGVRQMLALQNLKAQASAALLAMRAGHTPVPDEGVTLELRTRHPSSATPGQAWLQIAVTHDGQSATLWGLVPEAGIPATLQKSR